MKTVSRGQSMVWPRVLAGFTIGATAMGVMYFSSGWLFWLLMGSGVLFTYSVLGSDVVRSKEPVSLSAAVVFVAVLSAWAHVVQSGEISEGAWKTVPAVLKADFLTLDGWRSMAWFLVKRLALLTAGLGLLLVVGGRLRDRSRRLRAAAVVLAAVQVPADFAWRAPLVKIGVHEASTLGMNRVLAILSMEEPIVLFILVCAVVVAPTFRQRTASGAGPT